MEPIVSLIIVVYNGRPYLDGCLDSLRRTLPAATEVIVVDNGSTDGSAALVRARMPEARLLVNETNRGFAAACRQGADQARGEFLVFLNQDVRAEPGWLEALLEPFRDPTVGLTTPTILWMDDPERIQSCGQDVHYTGLVFARNFGASRAAVTGAPFADVAAVSGAAFAIRRKVWEELGGFTDMFYMYYEETDLSWRAGRAGYRCLHVPASVVYHAGRLDRPSPLALYCSFRNRILMGVVQLGLAGSAASLAGLAPGRLDGVGAGAGPGVARALRQNQRGDLAAGPRPGALPTPRQGSAGKQGGGRDHPGRPGVAPVAPRHNRRTGGAAVGGALRGPLLPKLACGHDPVR
jgi:GT2 family glycosyltransferase